MFIPLELIQVFNKVCVYTMARHPLSHISNWLWSKFRRQKAYDSKGEIKGGGDGYTTGYPATP